jgi:acyl-CoA thioesterase
MKPEEIVDKMFTNDAFSQWLGIEREVVETGYCELSMTVSEEMTNGFAIAHGGITYSLADSALAFAANSHGSQSVSIETSISHLKPLRVGDHIKAVAREKNRNKRTAIYEVQINKGDELVALFKGTVYITEKPWE